jgi:hypothetical protein
MRIRTVKPEFWSNETLALGCSDTDRLLALGLLNYADDEGFFLANPALVRSALRPFDDDSSIVRACLETLEKVGWISLCLDVNDRMCGWIVNFTKHQKIDRPKPSAIKPLCRFDDSSTINHRPISANVALEQGTGNREQGMEQGMEKEEGIPPVSPQKGTKKNGEDQTDFLEIQSLNRIRSLFRKRLNTPLDRGEQRAWKDKGNRAAVLATSAAEWAALEWFYGLPATSPAAKFRRRGIAQLLNNWNSESVRAQAAASECGVSLEVPPSEKKENWPGDWRERLTEADPERVWPDDPTGLPETVRLWAWEISEKKKGAE